MRNFVIGNSIICGQGIMPVWKLSPYVAGTALPCSGEMQPKAEQLFRDCEHNMRIYLDIQVRSL